MMEKRFYESLSPIVGAIDALKQMVKEGWDVRFCTSPLKEYENCVVEKYRWIERYFGFEWTRRIIVTKDNILFLIKLITTVPTKILIINLLHDLFCGQIGEPLSTIIIMQQRAKNNNFE